MSFADLPAETDIERVIIALDKLAETQQKQTEAINALGTSIQWIIDNAQGIFQMFSSPQFMSMISGAMGGGING